jgi:hypothetical protein
VCERERERERERESAMTFRIFFLKEKVTPRTQFCACTHTNKHTHTHTHTVGRFRLLPASNGLAFACITHARLGAACDRWAHELPSELLRRIIDTARHWPPACGAPFAGEGAGGTCGFGRGVGAGDCGGGGCVMQNSNQGILRLLGGWELEKCDTDVLPPRRLSGRGRVLSLPQRWRPDR